MNGARKRAKKAGNHVRDAIPRRDLDHPIPTPGGPLIERRDARPVAERTASELIDDPA